MLLVATLLAGSPNLTLAFTEAPIAPLFSGVRPDPFPIPTTDGQQGETALTAEEIAAARDTLRCSDTPFFWCAGGIGQEERAALAALANRFTLCVEWAERSRPFLASGSLKLLNETGERLFEVADVGPRWCAALPAGRYQVSASAQPLVEYPPQQRLVEIKGQGRSTWVTFRW